MKVLLVDDHKLVRSGLRRLLDDLDGVDVIAEADDGEQAITAIEDEAPDVVVTDIAMPGMNGLELTAYLARHFPAIRVIVLSMHSSGDYVVQALNAGASAYLLKNSAAEEMARALSAVTQGQTYLSSGVSHQLVDAYAKQDTRPPALRSITPRQRQVLHRVAQGRSSKEIALELGISPRTVDTHRADLMERLGARDAIGMLREAARLGLITMDRAE